MPQVARATLLFVYALNVATHYHYAAITRKSRGTG
jgi:hypothetical protein